MSRFYDGYGSGLALWEKTIAEPPTFIACDTETVSLADRRVLGLGIAVSPQDAFFITPDDPDWQRAVKLIQSNGIRKVWHNAPFDLRVMREWNPDTVNIDDTAIMCRLDGQSAILEDASFWTGKQTETAGEFMFSLGVKSMDAAPIDKVAGKCTTDALATFRLKELVEPRIDHAYYEVERQILPMLDSMSRRGIRLDQKRVTELYAYYNQEFNTTKAIAETQFGFNPGSPFQVGYMLATRGHFLPMTKGRTQLATDDKTIGRINDPLAGMVLYYRRVQKMVGTYLRPWLGAERAYTTLHMDAVTGRISSGGAGKLAPDRNLQNMPKKAEMGNVPPIRSIFIPDNKMFTFIDASQIELRVIAYMSRDPVMMAVFADPNGDIHKTTSETLGLTRDWAKIFNFNMFYSILKDGSVNIDTLSANIGLGDKALIRQVTQKAALTYPRAWAFMMEQIDSGFRDGYVRTMMGRKLKIPFDQGETHAAHCCTNFPIQGTAAEVFKRIMLQCRHLLPELSLQIHDELMFDGDVEIPSGLDHVTEMWTPLKMKKSERWAE